MTGFDNHFEKDFQKPVIRVKVLLACALLLGSVSACARSAPEAPAQAAPAIIDQPARTVSMAAASTQAETVAAAGPTAAAPAQAAGGNTAKAIFAGGCFWCMEPPYDKLPGVISTTSGYTAGRTVDPSYQQVSSGGTGHTEAVLVVYDPKETSLEKLLQVFWESHDPTQGMAQGNDRGTQYRSAIYCETQEQYDAALGSRDAYQRQLHAAGHGDITTEILYPAPGFFYAEEGHQQYLSKNPSGYCGLGGTGVSCQLGLEA